MDRTPRRVALILDLQWPFKRHSEIFSGVQLYAVERDWTSITEEFAHDTLQQKWSKADRYDGIVARANYPLARRAAKLGVPVVNIWPSSPARHLLPGVFPDSTETGRLVAEERGVNPTFVDPRLVLAEGGFAQARPPGPDAQERGPRAALGVRVVPVPRTMISALAPLSDRNTTSVSSSFFAFLSAARMRPISRSIRSTMAAWTAIL